MAWNFFGHYVDRDHHVKDPKDKIEMSEGL